MNLLTVPTRAGDPLDASDDHLDFVPLAHYSRTDSILFTHFLYPGYLLISIASAPNPLSRVRTCVAISYLQTYHLNSSTSTRSFRFIFVLPYSHHQPLSFHYSAVTHYHVSMRRAYVLSDTTCLLTPFTLLIKPSQ